MRSRQQIKENIAVKKSILYIIISMLSIFFSAGCGGSGQLYSTQEPEMNSKHRSYKIKFGYMKKNMDGAVYVCR